MTRIAGGKGSPYIANRTLKDFADDLLKTTTHGFATTVQCLIAHVRGISDDQIVSVARERFVCPCRERIAVNYPESNAIVAI